MKVYVEDNNISNLDDLFQATNSYECWAGNCGDDLEIVSLADYTKQVRKEVCEEIRKFAYDTFKEFGCFDEVDLEHILDQIQGNN